MALSKIRSAEILEQVSETVFGMMQQFNWENTQDLNDKDLWIPNHLLYRKDVVLKLGVHVVIRGLEPEESFLSVKNAFRLGVGKSLANSISCPLFGEVGAKDHQRFQASYATILKAHMTALKKRERKDKKKAAEGDKKEGGLTKKPKRA
ncbi:unnamed protein product [Dovyalis caffra]|uniref:Signal recognition particle 14 kDa protein n=1 Tax=Dovyalis caffra TaxID=77055 RepID=A0AAV1QQ57_9ROSI|nr:unnamed protein product [Dovyalis caffra]